MLNKKALGISLIVLNSLSVSVILIIAKYLMRSFCPVEVICLYKCLLFTSVVLWCCAKYFGQILIWDNWKGHFRQRGMKLLLLRCILGAIASIFFMHSLKYVDAINASALGYLEQVVWVFIGVIYFREKLTLMKIVASLLSLLGAAIILLQDSCFMQFYFGLGNVTSCRKILFDWHYLYILVAVLLWGINAGLTKRLTNMLHGTTQLLYTTFFTAILSIGAVRLTFDNTCEFMWITFSGSINLEIFQAQYMLLIIVAALCYGIHNLSFFFAMKYTDFVSVIPFDYLRLVFTGYLGYLVFDTAPTQLSYIGYLLIITCSLLLMKLECIRAK